MFDELSGSGLLLHHWDTDGICSARLLLERLSAKTIVNATPQLGNYFLTAEELSAFSGYEFVIIADMALPKENILSLAKQSKVFIFDHHLQPLIPGVFHHNPISNGEHTEKYPSASWVINLFFQNPVNVSAVLGIVGDHEKFIQTNKEIYPQIQAFCSAEGFTLDELLQMVSLIDSNYKVGEKRSVEEAVGQLLRYTDAHRILQHVRWKNNLAVLEKEIERILESAFEERGGVVIRRMHTKYNIISTVTRRMFWDLKKESVVMNTGFFTDRDQIYVRSEKNLHPLIEQGRLLGLRCGGKAEVMGAVVPKEKTEMFVQEILRFLSR